LYPKAARGLAAPRSGIVEIAGLKRAPFNEIVACPPRPYSTSTSARALQWSARAVSGSCYGDGACGGIDTVAGMQHGGLRITPRGAHDQSPVL
jgi:hypothetical protein